MIWGFKVKEANDRNHSRERRVRTLGRAFRTSGEGHLCRAHTDHRISWCKGPEAKGLRKEETGRDGCLHLERLEGCIRGLALGGLG